MYRAEAGQYGEADSDTSQEAARSGADRAGRSGDPWHRGA